MKKNMLFSIVLLMAAPVAVAMSPSQELGRASAEGTAQEVRSLLAKGADVNASSVGGVTPLMDAARNDRADIVEILLQAGANPNARTSEGLNVIEFIKRYNPSVAEPQFGQENALIAKLKKAMGK